MIITITSFFNYLHLLQEDKIVVLTYHNVVTIIEENLYTTVNISEDKFEE